MKAIVDAPQIDFWKEVRGEERPVAEMDATLTFNGHEIPLSVGVLGAVAARIGAAVVHYSTDYVYSGVTDRPWREDDTAAPVNTYGRSKLAGDEALLASGADALILRTSWVYDRRGRNFLLTMRRLLAERDEVRVVADQIGAPTWARLIAQGTALILAQTAADGFRLGDSRGVYNLTCGGATSWHGFAEAIRDFSGARCKVIPVPTAEYPLPAPRPPDSRLDNAKVEATFGVRPVSKREGGSVPVVRMLQSLLGVDSIIMGFGLQDDNLHSPNEKQHLPTYHRGIEAYIRFFHEAAQLG